jgi:hypothetical protein
MSLDRRRSYARSVSHQPDNVREEYRTPTARERAILEMLVSTEMPGMEELRAQIPHVRVARWDCGCASFSVQVDRSVAPQSQITTTPTVEAWSKRRDDPAGAFDLLLCVEDGWLAGVEIVDYVERHGDDSPAEIPAPEEWQILEARA